MLWLFEPRTNLGHQPFITRLQLSSYFVNQSLRVISDRCGGGRALWEGSLLLRHHIGRVLTHLELAQLVGTERHHRRHKHHTRIGDHAAPVLIRLLVISVVWVRHSLCKLLLLW